MRPGSCNAVFSSIITDMCIGDYFLHCDLEREANEPISCIVI